jgi:hypothetical protein
MAGPPFGIGPIGIPRFVLLPQVHVEHHDHGRAGGRTQFQFSLVDVLPHVLTAVMEIKVSLPIRDQSHEQGARLQFFERADVYP